MEKMKNQAAKNKRFSAFFAVMLMAALLLSLLSACGGEAPSAQTISANPADILTVYFTDVGQGDSILLTCGGQSMLVDAGENNSFSAVEESLRQCGVERLDYIAATHAHADHIGAMYRVIEEIGTDCFLMSSLSIPEGCDTAAYERMETALYENRVKCLSPVPGDTYALGGATVTVLGPIQACDEVNNCSLVMRVDYGTTSFLLAGDAEAQEEQMILESGAGLDCDVLKVGHHGSSGASSEGFLEAVSPDIAVICCGADNDYGHPHAETEDRLNTYAEEVYRTDWHGWIKICSDGKQITSETEKSYR